MMKNRFTPHLLAGLLACCSVHALQAQTDVTDTYLTNPSFENGFTDWEYSGLQTQTNTSFTLKDGDIYVEQWVSSGNRVADCYATQTVTNLPNGVYTLTVSAQNIQQNSSATQTGMYIFAGSGQTEVNVADDYSVTFTVINGQATIGFKTESATGNWIACDNFRLYADSSTLDDLHAELQLLIGEAQELTGQTMQTDVSMTLEAAIEAAQAELEATTDENLSEVATALSEAITAAQTSAEAYSNLEAAIETALEAYGDGSQTGSEEFYAVIAAAQEMLENTTAEATEVASAVDGLETAILAFSLANATGTVPTVVTDTRYARGATMAFGRSTISGVSTSELLEHGFCWSTEPEPTVLDNRTTEYLSNNGYIYVLRDLEPSTIYYIRAYAMTKDYAVGYGDPIKVITIPQGTITWTYGNEGDASTNLRISSAIASAVDYWNNLTSIKGLGLSVHYNSGVTTAECSYGGYMSVGPNSSYQQTGTILHEALHAVGVGTHSRWYGSDSPLRAGSGTGNWLGDRANEVLRFWDNDDTSIMTGDGTHMWPYGINGASEDTGSEVLYIGNSLIIQGLGEDGLPPTGGFSTPAYVFEQEDDVKYYIKNESTSRGLYTSYLVANENGRSLTWKEMTSSEALENDYAAWYITFNPQTCYYSFRNAGTGNYMTYYGGDSNPFRANKDVSSPTTTERFQVMRGRVDVTVGSETSSFTTRGYWIIYPQIITEDAGSYYGCLYATASSSGRTGVTEFDLGDDAKTQRWVFLTADELQPFESAVKEGYQSELAELLAQLREMAETPHTEDVEGTDDTFYAQLSSIETEAASEDITTERISELITEATTAGMTFLANATPASVDEPFDITFLMSDADISTGEGWSSTPTISYSCGEFYQQTFDFYQTITGLPAGTYQFMGQAFQRPGSAATVYANYISGTDDVTAEIYAGETANLLMNIAAEAQSSSLGGGESSVGSPVRYIPNDMQSASIYFAAGLYDNSVVTELEEDGSSLTVGLRSTETGSSYWCIFDNFRLYYYGSMTSDQVTAIQQVATDSKANGLFSTPADVYSISGIRVRQQATSLEGLSRGIYIVNGKKVVVK